MTKKAWALLTQDLTQISYLTALGILDQLSSQDDQICGNLESEETSRSYQGLGEAKQWLKGRGVLDGMEQRGGRAGGAEVGSEGPPREGWQ